MLNPYALNIQQYLEHAWHLGIAFFGVLGSESVNERPLTTSANKEGRIRTILVYT